MLMRSLKETKILVGVGGGECASVFSLDEINISTLPPSPSSPRLPSPPPPPLGQQDHAVQEAISLQLQLCKLSEVIQVQAGALALPPQMNTH